jgi:hypothetical protein
VTEDSRRKSIAVEVERGGEALEEAELLLAADKLPGSISRAYYAAFHYARALLLALGEEPRTHGGLHRLVMRDLVRTGELEPEMGEILSQLQSFRLEADYGAEFVFTSTKATEEVSNSRRFVATARQWLERGGWIAA